MILIDTNVLSQPTRSSGSPVVIRWIDDHFDDLLVPTLAISELLFGAHRLTDEAQRARLCVAHEAIVLRFSGKFIDFDLAAARLHGQISGEAARAGRMLAPSDSMIAAVAPDRGHAEHPALPADRRSSDRSMDRLNGRVPE